MSSSASTTVASSNAKLATITPMLTTTFVPKATACTENRLTMLANRKYEIWNNEPVPVPNITITDCYPTQFLESYTLLGAKVTQPAFNPLICPDNYETIGPYTSNYIACCPSGYKLANPTNNPFSDRPAFGGTCYTPIEMATPVLVTAYGSAGVTATITFSATTSNVQAYAYPYEGFAFGVAEVQSLTTPASSSTSSSAAPSSTTSSAATHKSGLSTGAKVGIALGVSIPVILLALLAWFFVARRKKLIRQSNEHPEVDYYANDTKTAAGTGAGQIMTYDNSKTPALPTKSSEVHGQSIIGELPGDNQPAAELSTSRFSSYMPVESQLMDVKHTSPPTTPAPMYSQQHEFDSFISPEDERPRWQGSPVSPPGRTGG